MPVVVPPSPPPDASTTGLFLRTSKLPDDDMMPEDDLLTTSVSQGQGRLGLGSSQGQDEAQRLRPCDGLVIETSLLWLAEGFVRSPVCLSDRSVRVSDQRGEGLESGLRR